MSLLSKGDWKEAPHEVGKKAMRDKSQREKMYCLVKSSEAGGKSDKIRNKKYSLNLETVNGIQSKRWKKNDGVRIPIGVDVNKWEGRK